MAVAVPDVKRKPIALDRLRELQTKKAGTDAESVAFTTQIQQLPAYQTYMRTLAQSTRASERNNAYRALIEQAKAAGIEIPDKLKVDTYGAVREKTWAEKHQVLQAALITAGFFGGGMALGAALAPAAAGAGTAALGPTSAASMAATNSAVAGGTVPAALGGAGAMPTIGAGAAAAGVGAGEMAATVGPGAGGGTGAGGLGPLASTSAGVPAAASGPLAGGASSGAALGGGGGAGGASVLGMSPSTWELIYGAGATGLNAYSQSKNSTAEREAALERARMGVAADENTRDPFRQQMSQIRNLGQMDMMERYRPSTPAAPVGKYANVVGPAQEPAYAPSAEMLQWIAQMKRNVAGGQNTAPTMTDPANYGKTSVLNLTSPGQAPPPSPTGAAPTLEEILALSKRQPQTQAQMRFGGLNR